MRIIRSPNGSAVNGPSGPNAEIVPSAAERVGFDDARATGSMNR
jgi:hypothetical protein